MNAGLVYGIEYTYLDCMSRVLYR